MKRLLIGSRDVGEIDVAFGSTAVPAKHRGDGLRELCAAGFVDTGVYPEEFEIVFGGLDAAEPQLFISLLLSFFAICYVFEGDFLMICIPGM